MAHSSHPLQFGANVLLDSGTWNMSYLAHHATREFAGVMRRLADSASQGALAPRGCTPEAHLQALHLAGVAAVNCILREWHRSGMESVSSFFANHPPVVMQALSLTSSSGQSVPSSTSARAVRARPDDSDSDDEDRPLIRMRTDEEQAHSDKSHSASSSTVPLPAIVDNDADHEDYADHSDAQAVENILVSTSISLSTPRSHFSPRLPLSSSDCSKDSSLLTSTWSNTCRDAKHSSFS